MDAQVITGTTKAKYFPTPPSAHSISLPQGPVFVISDGFRPFGLCTDTPDIQAYEEFHFWR